MTGNQREELSAIIAASLLDRLDEKGERILERWLDENPANRRFYDSLKGSFSLEGALSEKHNYDSSEGWMSVKRKAAKRRHKTLLRHSLYAASALCLAALFSVILTRNTPDAEQTAVRFPAADTVIKENYKALLLLPTGDVLDLGKEIELDNGNITNDGTALQYSARQSESEHREEPEMHLVSVPRGAEYKIVLDDGTLVHLNADSQLRYPDHFAGPHRTVELSGEAYFEVAHDPSKPFEVTNGNMKVTALGTAFNLKAYGGEGRQATLLEGRVGVEVGESYVEITPGHQACEVNGGLYSREVRADDYIGWKNRRLIYKSEPLRTVMLDIQRLYDCDIEFLDGAAAELRLTANVPRYENLGILLDIISQAVYADIRTEDGKIVIRNESHR